MYILKEIGSTDFMLTLNEVSLQKEFDGGCTVCAPVQKCPVLYCLTTREFGLVLI